MNIYDLSDPAVRDFIRQSMVARIATLSSTGRPSVTSLYFVRVKGNIWLGTADWTLAAREAKACPDVCILFQRERQTDDRRILRITGSAIVQTDPQTMRYSNLQMALKYILAPGALPNRLLNRKLWQAERRYHAQSAAKGTACIINVTPHEVEFIDGC